MSRVLATLAELDAGRYGAYPSGKGYEGGLDRPLHEPNPSVANPPKPSGSSSPPTPERSGKELYDLYKKFPGTTDDFRNSLSQGERDNFDIHRDSEVRQSLGKPPIGGGGAPPPPAPSSPPSPPSAPDPRMY